MIIPQPKEALHKAWLYRLLTAIYDDAELSYVLYFKGGTCAAMLGYLNRFSVDLDFDYVGDTSKLSETKCKLENIYSELGLTIGDQSQVVPQYFLKYQAAENQRNTLKIDVAIDPPAANTYEKKRFQEIDRIITCQTLETMVANKLVALTDRYDRNTTIAGRDIYDVHHFFLQGYSYDEKIIHERTQKTTPQFFKDLIDFVEQQVTEDIINQDINMLLPPDQFARLRKILKPETLMFLRDELKRLEVCG